MKFLARHTHVHTDTHTKYNVGSEPYLIHLTLLFSSLAGLPGWHLYQQVLISMKQLTAFVHRYVSHRPECTPDNTLTLVYFWQWFAKLNSLCFYLGPVV